MIPEMLNLGCERVGGIKGNCPKVVKHPCSTSEDESMAKEIKKILLRQPPFQNKSY